MSKDLKDVLEDAKDGRLKKASVKKLEDLAAGKPVKAVKEDKYKWSYDDKVHNSLAELKKSYDLNDAQVTNKINSGEINRIG